MENILRSLRKVFITIDFDRGKISKIHSYEKLAFGHLSYWPELIRAIGHPRHWIFTDGH